MNVCKLYKECKYPFFFKKQEFMDYLILDLVTYLEYLTVSCDDKLLRTLSIPKKISHHRNSRIN